jgi:hypothetical protein
MAKAQPKVRQYAESSMTELTEILYRTNRSISSACEELSAVFAMEDLEDLEQCSHCNVWWHDYELIPDQDDNQVCKFCGTYYGL